MDQQQAGSNHEPAVGQIEIRPRIKIGNAFEPEQNPIPDMITNRFGVAWSEAPANAIVKIS
jgi:hypothetical protein